MPVGKFPMIHYAIEKLREAGVEDILLIVNKESIGLFSAYLGSGRELGVSISYKIQEQAGGIAQALSLAESFIPTGEKFIVLLGDNIFLDSLKEALELFLNQTDKAMVFLKEVKDPQRYGVPIIHGGNIIFIEEKPSTPKSNYCVTGIYLYDSTVFDLVRQLKPSNRGELEITDVNNIYAVQGRLGYTVLNGWWTDAGTFESLIEAGNKMFKRDGDLL